MHRKLMLSICAALSMSVGALIASDARADSTVCDTGPFNFLSGPVGNIVVPTEKECFLVQATVNGNINVESGATLLLEGDVTVKGNISSLNSRGVFGIVSIKAPGPNIVTGNVTIDSSNGLSICGAHISGNLAITNVAEFTTFHLGFAVGGSGSPGCANRGGGNVIGGNVSITGADISNFFIVSDNMVGKNMAITNNLGSATKKIENNQVKGNLACSGNALPFTSDNNKASKLIGQCAPAP